MFGALMLECGGAGQGCAELEFVVESMILQSWIMQSCSGCREQAQHVQQLVAGVSLMQTSVACQGCLHCRPFQAVGSLQTLKAHHGNPACSPAAGHSAGHDCSPGVAV